MREWKNNFWRYWFRLQCQCYGFRINKLIPQRNPTKTSYEAFYVLKWPTD